MAKHEISIASVIQHPADRANAASLVLTTHQSNERAMQATLNQLAKLPSVLETPVYLRIAEFD
jgi:homoserine dehydrogenase